MKSDEVTGSVHVMAIPLPLVTFIIISDEVTGDGYTTTTSHVYHYI